MKKYSANLPGRNGVTVVEAAIGIIITSLVIIMLLNFYSQGVKGSRRGIEHLNNMGIASILMSQIEYDLMRASRIVSPLPGQSKKSAIWQFPSDSTGEISTISYKLLPEGIERIESRPGDSRRYIFCKGRKVDLSFDNLEFSAANVDKDKSGVLVALFVSSPPKPGENPEEFQLIRLVSWRKPVK